MNKKVAIILVNYKDYAEKYLAECLASLKKQDYAGEMKIFITDNESAEESYNYLKQILEETEPPLFPPCQGGEDKIPPAPVSAQGRSASGGKVGKYEIIRNKNNDGFAKGNNDAMKAALAQGFDYIILFNLDTVLEPDCVRKMIKAVESEIPPAPFVKGGKRKVGAVQARLMLYDAKDKINSLGNVTHFLGFGYAEGYGEEYKTPLNPPFGRGAIKYNPSSPPCQGCGNICYPSGAAVLFTKGALEKVGLFDEEFWMYNEDQDLGWRIWLAGFSCVLAPEAVVYHKYEFSRSIKKYYFLDRNRMMVILKNYHWLTLILILPALILMEIGLIFFAYKNGWFYEKMKVYSYFLNLNNWRKIMAERKIIQAARTVPDSQIVKMFSGKIWYQEIGETRLRIANVIFGTYWKVVKILIRW